MKIYVKGTIWKGGEDIYIVFGTTSYKGSNRVRTSVRNVCVLHECFVIGTTSYKGSNRVRTSVRNVCVLHECFVIGTDVCMSTYDYS